MFDKLKQMKQLHDLQKSLAQEKVEIEKNGIKVVMNGKMEVEQIQLNPEMEHGEQARILKEILGDAMKQIQRRIASVMQNSGLGL